MATPDLKLSDLQRKVLELVLADTKHWERRNATMRRGRIRHRNPEGYQSPPTRTLMALHRRGLVSKEELEGENDKRLWRVTELGRQALNG